METQRHVPTQAVTREPGGGTCFLRLPSEAACAWQM